MLPSAPLVAKYHIKVRIYLPFNYGKSLCFPIEQTGFKLGKMEPGSYLVREQN